MGTPIGETVEYLNTVVPLMRALGVTEHAGTKLGPTPTSESAADDPKDETKRMTPEQIIARQREERRRVAMAASGGPIPRLGR